MRDGSVTGAASRGPSPLPSQQGTVSRVSLLARRGSTGHNGVAGAPSHPLCQSRWRGAGHSSTPTQGRGCSGCERQAAGTTDPYSMPRRACPLTPAIDTPPSRTLRPSAQASCHGTPTQPRPKPPSSSPKSAQERRTVLGVMVLVWQPPGTTPLCLCRRAWETKTLPALRALQPRSARDGRPSRARSGFYFCVSAAPNSQQRPLKCR